MQKALDEPVQPAEQPTSQAPMASETTAGAEGQTEASRPRLNK